MRWATGTRWLVILGVGLSLYGEGAAPPLAAHEDPRHRVAALTARLAATPEDPVLYLKRGDLHHALGDWTAAIADYDRAARLAPDLIDVRRALGRTWLAAGRPDRAKEALDWYLAVERGDADALVLRARSLARLGDRLAAARDLSGAIDLLEAPAPALFLERARLLADGEPAYPDEALAGLDEGIAELGPVVTLIQLAVEIAAEHGRHGTAIEHLDALPAPLATRPEWIAERGDILSAAGKPEAANAAYRAALAAIEALPTRRRAVPTLRKLETRLRQELKGRSMSGRTGASTTGDGALTAASATPR